MRLLTKLEIFPDFSATGLWGTYDDGQGRHECVLEEDLPHPLPPHVKYKIHLMNQVYETFGSGFDEQQHGMMTESSLSFMLWEIYRDLAHHPLRFVLEVPDWLLEDFKRHRRHWKQDLPDHPFFDAPEEGA